MWLHDVDDVFVRFPNAPNHTCRTIPQNHRATVRTSHWKFEILIKKYRNLHKRNFTDVLILRSEEIRLFDIRLIVAMAQEALYKFYYIIIKMLSSKNWHKVLR